MLLNFVPEWCSMLHALAQRFDVVQSRIPWNIKWTSPTTIHQKNGGSIVRSPIRASYVATCTSTRVGKWDRWVCLLRETTLEIRPFLATGSIFPIFPQEDPPVSYRYIHTRTCLSYTMQSWPPVSYRYIHTRTCLSYTMQSWNKNHQPSSLQSDWMLF